MNGEPTPEDVIGPKPDDEDLMNVAEVADYFRVKHTTVKQWLKSGMLPGAFWIRGPVGWRIPRSSVRNLREEFSAQTKVKSSNPYYHAQKQKRGQV